MLQSFTGKSIKIGSLFLQHETNTQGTSSTTSDVAGASFYNYAAISSAVTASGGVVSAGGCLVSQSLSASAGAATSTALNAGAITVKSPAGTTATLTTVRGLSGIYVAPLPTGFITSSGGSFAFHAAAGSDVGAFDTSLTLPTPLLS